MTLPQPIKTHIPSVCQLLLSIYGLVTSLFSVLSLWMVIQISKSMPTSELQIDQQYSSLIWIVLLLAGLAIPSLILSIQRLSRKTMPVANPRHRLLISSLLCLLLIPILFLIYKTGVVSTIPSLMSILTILFVAIPLWWFVEFGQNKLNIGSPQKRWGLVSFEIFASMPLAIVIELFLIILVFIIGGIWLSQQAEFKPLLITLQTQLMLNPEDIQGLVGQFTPLLQKPQVLSCAIFMVAFLIPLVEEVTKPLALWFFIKHEWLPSDGFVAGLICGASFALVESVTALASISQEVWVATLVGRIGTGLLHTVTTGLTGWALASSWRDGKYKRVGIAYLISVTIHGLWNFFALLYGFGTNIEFLGLSSFSSVVNVSPWILGSLIIVMLSILFALNRKNRPSDVPPSIPALPGNTLE